MNRLGKTTWVIPGGRIPAQAKGHEPEFTSRDEIWLLNTGDGPARVEIMLFYEDREPVGPYRLEVSARRVRCTRVNDLIDPEAVFLDRSYATVIQSTHPIVVQIARYDTRQAEQTMSWSVAFPAD